MESEKLRILIAEVRSQRLRSSVSGNLTLTRLRRSGNTWSYVGSGERWIQNSKAGVGEVGVGVGVLLEVEHGAEQQVGELGEEHVLDRCHTQDVFDVLLLDAACYELEDEENRCECVHKKVQPLSVVKTLIDPSPIVQLNRMPPGIVQESLRKRWLELADSLVLWIGFEIGVQGLENYYRLDAQTTFPT